MSKADNAITKIEKALADVGSDIVIVGRTFTGYNSINIPQYDDIETASKAFIGSSATPALSKKLNKDLIGNYDNSFRFIFENFTKEFKIKFDGDTYTPVHIEKTILQNKTLLLEVLASK